MATLYVDSGQPFIAAHTHSSVALLTSFAVPAQGSEETIQLQLTGIHTKRSHDLATSPMP
jgi:hypothetical protein